MEDVRLDETVFSEVLDMLVSSEVPLGIEEDVEVLCSLLGLDEALGLDGINEQLVKANNAVR